MAFSFLVDQRKCGATQFLLVHDLGRPERFLPVILTPNPASWLVRGAWVLPVTAPPPTTDLGDLPLPTD